MEGGQFRGAISKMKGGQEQCRGRFGRRALKWVMSTCCGESRTGQLARIVGGPRARAAVPQGEQARKG